MGCGGCVCYHHCCVLRGHHCLHLLQGMWRLHVKTNGSGGGTTPAGPVLAGPLFRRLNEIHNL